MTSKAFRLLLLLAVLAALVVVPATGVPPARAQAPAAPEMVSFAPFRVLDTRTAGGALAAGGVLRVPAAGRLGVPADAAAVVLNVAAVVPSAGGHLTVWPCGQPRPVASTLNFSAGRTVANMAVAQPGDSGDVCVSSPVQTHVIADVAGYWPAGSAYAARTPVRFADTRGGAPVAARGVLRVPVAGRLGIPSDAAALALNVAAVTPSAGGHLTVWPCGAARPTASNVNFAAGRTTADAVLVKPGTGGEVCVYTHAQTHLIVDVSGHLAPGSVFVARTPVRIADTRSTAQVRAGGTLTVSVAGAAGVPAGAGAASVTVTAVTPAGGGHLTVHPCGAPRPTASNVNYTAGATMAAAAIARLGDGGRLCIYTSAATHIVVDLNGYYAADALGAGASAVAAGNDSTCAILPGGYVKCWGHNDYGQLGDATTTDRAVPTAVQGLSGAIGVSTSRTFACAVLAAGTVKCWGSNDDGQLGDGTTISRTSPVPVAGLQGAVEVAVGASHSCARTTDGRVACWGRLYGSGAALRTVAGVAGAVAIGSGDGFSCALLAGGAVRCWGVNTWGELGDGTRVPRASAVAVAGLAGVTGIGVGYGTSCALLADTTVRCWGYNSEGQLGDGTLLPRSGPVTVAGLVGAASVAGGGSAMCALMADGTARCWGDNWSGSLGDQSGRSSTTPVAVAGLAGAVGLSSGARHSCAMLPGGNLRCWGNDVFGELGEATPEIRPVAVAPAVAGATAAGASEHTTCALVGGGRVQCWGDNTYGQLGDGAAGTAHWTPRDVVGITGAKAVGVGLQFACALAGDATVRCWGRNSVGQLGDATTTDSDVPVAVRGLSGVTALAVGADLDVGSPHACAVLADRTVRCWGGNGSGQLGDGTFDDSPVPVAVKQVAGATAVAAGTADSCAIVDQGRVRCWGSRWVWIDDDDGGRDELRPYNELVPGLSGASAVAAGSSGHMCALVGGTVRCWGSNTHGQLGTGTTTDSTLPVAVAGITGATAIGAGAGTSCAVVAGGAVRCWGRNDSGQLGDGTLIDRATPVPVLGVTGARSLALGMWHGGAVLSGGGLRMWGYNGKGELGIDPGWSPVAVRGL